MPSHILFSVRQSQQSCWNISQVIPSSKFSSAFPTWRNLQGFIHMIWILFSPHFSHLLLFIQLSHNGFLVPWILQACSCLVCFYLRFLYTACYFPRYLYGSYPPSFRSLLQWGIMDMPREKQQLLYLPLDYFSSWLYHCLMLYFVLSLFSPTILII